MLFSSGDPDALSADCFRERIALRAPPTNAGVVLRTYYFFLLFPT